MANVSPLQNTSQEGGNVNTQNQQQNTNVSNNQGTAVGDSQSKELQSQNDLGNQNQQTQPSNLEKQETSNKKPSIQANTDKMKMSQLLDLTIQNKASDLHITVDYPIFLRIDGELRKLGTEIITPERSKELIYEVLDDKKREIYEVNKEVDLSYSHENKARFRINAYNERGRLAAAFRLIPSKIRSIEELYLPKILHEFTKIPQGLVLVVGPTGHGKSTTLAAMLQEINTRDAKHIITIEDPIEYIYPPARGLVDQRELNQDTHSWEIALRNVLRQDPDVILVGEMRDFDTIAATITAAETGHLVFATLHTNSAAQSMDRIIDVFPEYQQSQIRMQMSNVIEAVVSQRLVPVIGGGRRAAIEVMIGTAAVRNAIREDKTYQIDNIVQTSADVGMITLERSLVELIREGKITMEEAQNYSTKPEDLLRLVKR